MKLRDKISGTDKQTWKWISVGITVLIAVALTLWGIYAIGQYGIALFFLTPLFMGAASSIFYGYRNRLTKREARNIAFLTLGIYTLGLLIFAIEGLICIAMAAPMALLLTWIGSLIGHATVNDWPDQSGTLLLILIAGIPSMAFVEKNNAPTLTSVVTSIEIDAAPATVWKNVIEFPELEEPEEFLFKAGIAYPINARIEGSGIGAVRHCNFTTGSFVEPVTVWDEPRLLKFSVVEQPAPMKELSFWDVNAPHLHDYFVSKEGQFKLTALPNGKTLLEGTTWYYHNIKPAFYWQIWSDYFIHKIHNRVLLHIKKNSERGR